MNKNLGSKKPSFKLNPMCAAVLLAFSVNANANPNGGAVVNGSASFNTNGNTLTVTNTPGTIINWQGFSINSNEITHFAQQSASSAVLNRVITSNPSVILGTLSSNGRVFLVNPSGIVFGAGSTVDVAGMVATSLNLSDADFLAGRGNFTLTPGAQAVSNAGNITAQSGGEIYLIAPNVENSGVITAPNGEILLAAGHEVQLVNTLDPNLRVNITAPAGDATNVGQLVASAGRLGLFGTVVKNAGAVSADSATMQGGKIVFKASQRVELGGTVSANGVSGGSVNVAAAHSADVNTPGVVVQTGTIDAQGTRGAGGSVQVNADNVLSSAAINVNGATAGGQIGVVATGDVVTTSGAIYSANGGTASGGDILVAAGANSYSSGSYLAQGATGGNIAMTASNLTLSAAKLDASGTNGGGVIHVGGVLHGAAGFAAQGIALSNAGNLTVTGTTKLIADALQNGNGGEIVLWSDGTTLSGGAISAHGGALSGNGGFVEVSGKQTLGYAGALDVSAPNGASGTLLLDPANIVIDSTAPQGGALSGVVSATLVDPHPIAGNKFGSYTTVLTNGNVVVAVPNDSLVNSAAGAVYLFDGTTGALISTLTGSSVSDQVGVGGVTALTNGNFVVNSWLWHSLDLGAITWGSGTTGVNGAVSGSNSLVGLYQYDNIGAPSVVTGWDARANTNTTIGHGGVIALTNGNYVVSSPWAYGNGGMVTWGNGLGGTVGSVSAANSLVGTVTGDFIGTNVVALSNGNYVVGSSNFKNGAGVAIGAATWGNGLGGTVGSVSVLNSLIGSTNYDTVGASITALSNGNYVVNSYGWSNNSGAVTWGSGTTGVKGPVSAVESLVGTPGQNIGWGSGINSTDGVVALVGNGNYVVNSSSAGFVTWGNGTGGTVGNLSSGNSLQGTAGSYSTKVTALANGHYVVASPQWNPGAVAGAGAVTWGNGTTGTVGVVSVVNSLVGSALNDNVGSGGITVLSNSSYVVTSHNWDNGAVVNAGAVTWGNGLGGIVGTVSSANSLVGSTANDMLGWNGFQSSVVALSNGNYVVGSKSWDNGGLVDAGAATWGDGLEFGTRLTGTVSAANSLVGSTASDLVGFSVTALKGNGNYVVSSSWANGAATAAGAATWGNGLGGTVGTISAANSLVGTTASDGVGSKVEALANGNYVVLSSNWDNGAATNAGAATWGDGAAGITGTVSSANSLVGDTASDQIGGWYFTALSNGNYVVNTPGWHSNTGHVALGNGTTGLSGVASSTNGAVGAVAGDYLGYDYVGAGSAGGTGNGIRVLPNGGYVISSINYNGGMSTGFGLVTLEGISNSKIPFALNSGTTTSINPLDIAAKLNAGANIVLQANNDITQNVGAAITATGAGSLTLQAGRSILLQDSISIVGNLFVTANDPNAILADRALGTAVLDASAATLSAGAMTFANSDGNILLNNLTTTGTVVSNALGSTTLSGTNNMFMLDARTFDSGAGSGWVNIASGSTTTTDTTLANPLNIGRLDMAGGTLTVAKNMTIGTTLNWGGGTIASVGSGLLGTGSVTTNITGAATLTGFSVWNNPGTININGAGVLTLDGTTLAIYSALGILNLNGTALTPITSLNGGAISEYAGGVINKNVGSATSQTINAGLNFMAAPISPAGGLNVNEGTLILGGATSGVLSGTFNVASAATLDMGATAYTFAATSTLTGNGTFKASTGAANTITTLGTITPGGSSGTGTLSIVGDLLMDAGSLLKLNVNGASAGQYDVLSVSGAATIASGTLNVLGVGGAGSYTVLTTGASLAGATFGTVVLDTMTLTQDSITTPTNLALNISANTVAGFTFWDGGAGTYNWADALNWSADVLPTLMDNIYIANQSSNVIAIASGAQLGNKLVCDADFTLSGGSLALSGTAEWTGVTSITGGVLNTSSATTMSSLTWVGGTITGSGVLDVGTLNIAAGYATNGVHYTYLDGKTLNINGNSSFGSGVGRGVNGADLTLSNGAVINNKGIFGVSNIANIIAGTGGGTFNNFGEVRVGQTVAATATISTVFNNDNSIMLDLIHGANVYGGSLTVAGGGSSGFDSFIAAAGATVRFTNGYTFGAATNFDVGTLELAGGAVNAVGALRAGTVNVTGAITSSSAALTLQSQNDIIFTSTGAVAATGSLSMIAGNNILLEAGGSITSTTASPLNVTLTSDADGVSGGGIYLDTGSSINSSGGNIWMGGVPSTGRSIGNGSVSNGITFNSGIYVLGDITAGAGNVTLRGASALADGIAIAGGLISSNGVVTLDGATSAAGNISGPPYPIYAGVNFSGTGTRLATVTGAVSITGSSTLASGMRSQGVLFDTATVESSGTGTISVIGSSIALDTDWGVGFVNGGTLQTTAATSGGAISVTGTSAQDGGIVILNGHVLSNSGAITLLGTNTSGVYDAINIGSASTIGGATAGSVTLNSGGGTTTELSGGSIMAAQMRLLGTGAFSLSSSSNDVDVLAANVNGVVTYNDANGFNIGSVSSFDGSAVTTTTGVTTTLNNFTASANSTGNITLDAGSFINTGSSNISLSAAGGHFINNSGSATPFIAMQTKLLTAGPAGNTRSGLVPTASFFNCTDITCAPASIPTTGVNFLYVQATAPTLTITANAVSKVYGDVGPALTYGTSGLVVGDTIGEVLSGGLSRANGENVGVYAISQTGLNVNAAYGYNVNYVGANFTISPFVINLTGSRIYDSTALVDAAILVMNTLPNSETLTLGGAGVLANKNVGTDRALGMGTLALSDGTGLASNYTLVGGTHLVTVGAATITTVSGITANNRSYDGTSVAGLTTSGAVFNGMLGGDVLNVAGATGSFADKNVGAGKAVSIAGITMGGADAGNYILQTNTASSSADITKATLTVTADSTNKVLGTTDPALTYMVAGLYDPQNSVVGGFLSRDLGETIGSYSINGDGLVLLSSNYTMNYVAGTFRILAPTVVQEITQTTVGSGAADEEKTNQDANDLLAEAAADDSSQSLAAPLPVCQ